MKVIHFRHLPEHTNLALAAWADLKTIMSVSLKGKVKAKRVL
jgi:hypothetical protein